MKNIVVMTATITPKSDSFSLARTDPDLRRRDYELSLQYYLDALLRGSFDQLVFAENSGANLDSLRALVNKAGLAGRVEFLSLYGLDYPSAYSRGYGEFLLLDRVMDCPLMRTQCADSIVWKITGRYRVANIEKLILRRPKHFDFYCNCRDYPVRLTDQYLQAWRVGVYARHLKGLYKFFRESETAKYGEQVMRELIDQGRFESLHVIPRFTHVPIIKGVRGWNNKEYGGGAMNRCKLLVRQTANLALPWLWI
jgi:hypothetical protein